MDVVGLKKHIIDNPQCIGEILETLEFYKVRDFGREFRCGHNADTSGSSIRVSKQTLSYQDFVSDECGDIITLVQNKLDYTFGRTIRWLASYLELEDIELKKKEIKLPFGGFFRNIHRTLDIEARENNIYDEELLLDYPSSANKRFIVDNIDIDTQLRYGVGYDSITGRITVPWRDINGRLIGIMGRYNSEDLKDVEKWFPIIKFAKSSAIYGYSENYSDITRKKMCVIVESEKGAMQLSSMGFNIGLAMGSNSIGEYRAKCIKSLMCETIIVAFDEGLDVNQVIEKAQILKYDTPFYRNNVGIIYDKDNKVIEKGSKASPTDLGKESFLELMTNHVIWI